MSRALSAAVRNWSAVARPLAVRASSTHVAHKSDIEIAREHQATLNDIPIPAGSWQENYDRRNAKWNILLGASVVAFGISAYLLFNDLVFFTYSVSEQKKTKINPK